VGSNTLTLNDSKENLRKTLSFDRLDKKREDEILTEWERGILTY